MPSIYIETSIVSFLTARSSTNVLSSSRQWLTQKWWDESRLEYDLVTSQFVLDEASQGDQAQVAQRLAILHDLPLLEITPEVFQVADALLMSNILPSKARLDALHISIAAFHEVEYLLTWNCKHIANASILPLLYRKLVAFGLSPPLVCTVEEMMGYDDQLE
jgi:hypothetical protein